MIEPNSMESSPEESAEPVKEEATLKAVDSVDSQAQIQGLEKQLDALKSDLKEKENKYIYLYAEFENYKRRSIKERADLLKYGSESFAREILHSIDNLERALKYVPSNMDKNFAAGIEMVLKELHSTLQKQGVQPIESLEKDFDPHLHEAVGQEKSNLPSGKVIREQLPGYTFHGRLLRPAKVVVSQGES